MLGKLWLLNKVGEVGEVGELGDGSLVLDVMVWHQDQQPRARRGAPGVGR